MRIPKKDIPLQIRRRAAQLLESLRGTPMGEGLDEARIADEITPMYRPDVQGVAYYEFALDHGASGGERRGFFILSAGDHDFPNPHWSAQRPPVSDELTERARKHSKKVDRIYKVDALGYLAEDENGEESARSGDMPLPFSIPEGTAGEIVSETAAVASQEPDGQSAKKAKHEVKKSSAKESPIKVRRDITSWKQLKSQYRDALRTPLGHLRGHARKAWEIEGLAEKFGEGLLVGETHRVALLEPDAKFSASGAGAAVTDIRLIEHGGGAFALELRPRELPADGGAELILGITYPTGESESLKFFIVSRDGHSDMQGKLGGL